MFTVISEKSLIINLIYSDQHLFHHTCSSVNIHSFMEGKLLLLAQEIFHFGKSFQKCFNAIVFPGCYAIMLIDDGTSWQNCKIDELTNWQNNLLIGPVDKKANRWLDKLTKWQIDDMTSWKNGKLIIWPVDKMANCWLD